MKKTFPLEVPNHQPPRVIESIKHEVRKYLKRERRKALPEGIDFWDFDCRVGQDEPTATPCHVEEVIKGIDTASEGGWSQVYLEILAKPGVRTRKPTGPKD